MTDDDTEYIVDSAYSWGKGRFETEALQRMAEYAHAEFDETEEVTIFRVRGFEEMGVFGLKAEEILSEETVELDGRKLSQLSELLGDAELLAEEIVVEGEEVEE